MSFLENNPIKRLFPFSSSWVKFPPTAVSDASMFPLDDFSQSGPSRIGALAIKFLILWNGTSHFSSYFLILYSYLVTFVKESAFPEKFLIKIRKNYSGPRKLKSSVNVFGCCYDFSTSTFSLFTRIPLSSTVSSRKSLFVLKKSQFLGETYMLYYFSLDSTISICSRCDASSLLNISNSSMYTTMRMSMKSWKILFVKV